MAHPGGPFATAGLLLTRSSDAGVYLAAMQWTVFVAPTLWHCRNSGWDLKRVFRLEGCSVKWIGIGALRCRRRWSWYTRIRASRTP